MHLQLAKHRDDIDMVVVDRDTEDKPETYVRVLNTYNVWYVPRSAQSEQFMETFSPLFSGVALEAWFLALLLLGQQFVLAGCLTLDRAGGALTQTAAWLVIQLLLGFYIVYCGVYLVPRHTAFTLVIIVAELIAVGAPLLWAARAVGIMFVANAIGAIASIVNDGISTTIGVGTKISQVAKRSATMEPLHARTKMDNPMLELEFADDTDESDS